MRFLTILSDRGVYIFSILVSIILLYTLRTMPLVSKMFPMALLVILIGISGILLFTSRKQYAAIDLAQYRTGYIVYAFFVLYLVAMQFFGYFIATLIFLAGTMLLLKPKASKTTVAVMAFVVAGSLTACFSKFFQVPLP